MTIVWSSSVKIQEHVGLLFEIIKRFKLLKKRTQEISQKKPSLQGPGAPMESETASRIAQVWVQLWTTALVSLKNLAFKVAVKTPLSWTSAQIQYTIFDTAKQFFWCFNNLTLGIVIYSFVCGGRIWQVYVHVDGCRVILYAAFAFRCHREIVNLSLKNFSSLITN